MNILLFPECRGENQQDCVELQTPGQHEERENPFCGGRHLRIVALKAGNVGAETGVADRRQRAEKSVIQGEAADHERHGSDDYDNQIEKKEGESAHHDRGGSPLAVNDDGLDSLRMHHAVEFIPQELPCADDTAPGGRESRWPPGFFFPPGSGMKMITWRVS